jgi:hypothetical protein
MSGGEMKAAQIRLYSQRVNGCFPEADICNPLPEHMQQHIQPSEYAAAFRYYAGGGVQ